jgi:hypothetical protein
MAQYIFTTPTVEETPMGGGVLFSRYKMTKGVSVLRINGIYSSYRYPAQTDIATASEFYLGGTKTVITQETADALTAQGYGEYITPV